MEGTATKAAADAAGSAEEAGMSKGAMIGIGVLVCVTALVGYKYVWRGSKGQLANEDVDQAKIPSKVLVTGSSGYVGNYLLKAIAK